MPHVDFPQSICQAAIAERDITPPVGMYHRMWGAATHDRSTGIHRPLRATALALRAASGDASGAAEETKVLVGIDHCLLWTEEMDALRAAVSRIAGLPMDQLHITFSHTHAAGLLDPLRADLPGGELIAGYLERLAEQIAAAVQQALSTIQPAHIVYGVGRCDLARNRDLWDAASQQFVCGFNPGGSTDDTVIVARITDQRLHTIGTIVNYACHPTTLAWENTLVSPDFVGAMRELIESATGAPCLFLQGASADLGPSHGFVGNAGVADRNGRQLGYAALSALEALPAPAVRFEYTGPVISGATIGTWAYRPLGNVERFQKQRWRGCDFHVDLPYRTDLPNREQSETQLAEWQAQEQAATLAAKLERARDCRAQIERITRQLARLRGLPPGETYPLAVSVWQLGDAIWVSLEAEHYHILQRQLRERFPQHPIIVATMTNGWRPGYLPPTNVYGQGIYQETIALVAAGSLEQVIEKITARITDSLA